VWIRFGCGLDSRIYGNYQQFREIPSILYHEDGASTFLWNAANTNKTIYYHNPKDINSEYTLCIGLAADWLAPQESDCSRMHSKVSSDQLPSYIKATRPVFKIFNCLDTFRMALIYFPCLFHGVIYSCVVCSCLRWLNLLPVICRFMTLFSYDDIQYWNCEWCINDKSVIHWLCLMKTW
jgi:hypothetical protein